MKKIFALAAVVTLALGASCGGGPKLYTGTDVCEVYGFQLEKVGDLKMSGGVLHEGSLEYKGSGSLSETFRQYVTSMGTFGWTSATQKMDGDKATATLRKDNRTCTVDMINSSGSIKASIKVAATQ